MSDIIGAIHEIEALAFATQQFVEATAGSSGDEREDASRRALAMAALLADRANDLVRYCSRAGLADAEELAELQQDFAASAQRVTALEQEQAEARDVLRDAGMRVTLTGHGLAHDIRDALRVAREEERQ